MSSTSAQIKAAAADKSIKFNTNIGISAEGVVDDVFDFIEDYDSPDECMSSRTYSGASSYEQKRIPGKVSVAHAGVGVARVKDGILEADARGPQAAAIAKATALGVEARAGSSVGQAFAKVGPIVGASAQGPNAGAGVRAKVTGVGAEFNLGLGSVSANVGPVTAKAGFDIDSGVSAGLDGVSAKVLGTGISIGNGLEFSFFGSSLRLF